MSLNNIRIKASVLNNKIYNIIIYKFIFCIKINIPILPKNIISFVKIYPFLSEY